MNSIFTEVPVKVQIPATLNLVAFKQNNNKPPARLYEEAIPRTGNRKFIWSGLTDELEYVISGYREYKRV